jgi:lipopolysaccharide transport system permease protein
MTQDLWAGRELAWRLAVRDISAQYRQSALGVLWALIIPLANTAVWLFLTGSKVVQVAATAIPYPVFVFTGTLLWSILIDALNAPLMQVNANKALLAKINFPREALILSGIVQTAFNGAIKLGILLLVLPSLGVHPGWGGLLIPMGLFSLVLTGTAVGLLLTPLGVLYGDVGRSIPLITQFLMYLAQPAHAADSQCPRLVHGPAAAAAGRVGAGGGRLRGAAAAGVDGVSAGNADPDRADERLRHSRPATSPNALPGLKSDHERNPGCHRGPVHRARGAHGRGEPTGHGRCRDGGAVAPGDLPRCGPAVAPPEAGSRGRSQPAAGGDLRAP